MEVWDWKLAWSWRLFKRKWEKPGGIDPAEHELLCRRGIWRRYNVSANQDPAVDMLVWTFVRFTSTDY
jgi:hypothetical protein